MSELQDDLYDGVVEGVKEGKSYRNIAKELGISKSKVESIVKKARENGTLSKGKDAKKG